MKKKVFISKGNAGTVEQNNFIEAILDTLTFVGLDPRIMNTNEWSHEQPLKAIKKIISDCDGLVIIAFTRTHFPSGYEFRKDHTERELTDISLPTTWNHIEGALAYSLDMPILVIAENGLKSEGLIEQGYDWTVYWTDLNPEIARYESFRGFVTSWKAAVEKYSNKEQVHNEIDPGKLRLGNFLKAMTIAQLWAVASAIICLLLAVATIFYKLGSNHWP